MNVHHSLNRSANRRARPHGGRPDFECIALLLQGGGALGAYQGGVYQALAEADLHPDWVAGISIGAINAAIIAGNPAEARADQLLSFWKTITAQPVPGWLLPEPYGDLGRSVANQWHANTAAAFGAAGFFAPHTLHPMLQPAGTAGSTSFYDVTALKGTLERFVDFDRINRGEMRFSVGAVNVATGNFVYFDNSTHVIRPEHIMASGALPPGFPPIEIEGEHYWDGGLVSNTPLQWVLECPERRDTLAFQVDLWNSRGAVPRTLPEVMTRQKEIQYSSRTRANSDRFKYEQKLRNALADLMAKVPEELRNSPEWRLLRPEAAGKVYNVIQLIYRSKDHESGSKDFEFSRRSMEDHWAAGYHDTVRTLRHPEVLERPNGAERVVAFDLAADGRM